MQKLKKLIKTRGYNYCLFKYLSDMFLKHTKYNMAEKFRNIAWYFWSRHLKNKNQMCEICFFGDSITNMSNFEYYFSNKTICNLGYSGDTIDNMLNRVDMIKYISPQKIFVMAGINNIPNDTPEEIVNKISILITNINKLLPFAKIYLQCILPINTKNYKKGNLDNNKVIITNCLLKQYANQNNILFIDFYNNYLKDSMLNDSFTNDGIHLNGITAYANWAEMLQPYINC